MRFAAQIRIIHMIKKVVSNTQVTMRNTCKQQHHYRFVIGIEPTKRNLSKPIYRGIVGHDALAAFYTCYKEGLSVESCKEAAFQVIKAEMKSLDFPDDFERVEILAELKSLIEAYTEYSRSDSFIVHEVETVHQVDLTDSIAYGWRLDLLIELTKGEFKGDLVVMDHKFIYNFKSDRELKMDGQFPKYIEGLRKNGLTVTKGICNQLRYRPIKDPTPDQIFKRSWVMTNPTQRETIWKEQTEAAKEIVLNTAPPHRTLSGFICRSCYFATICDAELDGIDATQLIATQYQPTTYGYVDLSPEVG